MFGPETFWSAFKAAGMLAACRYLRPGGSVAKEVDVRWTEPDEVDMLRGVQSKTYEIEYRTIDMPDLAEGTALAIQRPNETVFEEFRVRQAPTVNSEGGDDGTYRRAVLTKED